MTGPGGLLGSDAIPDDIGVVFAAVDPGTPFAFLSVGPGSGSVLMTLTNVTQVPEPSTVVLLLAAFGYLAGSSRSRLL